MSSWNEYDNETKGFVQHPVFNGVHAEPAHDVVNPMVFSYATPEQVKQAKIEAVQWKMAQKLAELKHAMGQTLGSLDVNFERTERIQASSLNLTTQQAIEGSIDQFQALVLPPDAPGGTSKFVVKGRQHNYLEASKTHVKGNVQTAYETFDEGEGHQRASKRKTVEVEAPPQADQHTIVPDDAAKDLLRRSLKVSYVPVKVDKPPHKSLSTSAHVYEQVRSEVDRQLLQPHRAQRTQPASGTSSGGKAWQGFVENRLDTQLSKVIEEDLTSKAVPKSNSTSQQAGKGSTAAKPAAAISHTPSSAVAATLAQGGSQVSLHKSSQQGQAISASKAIPATSLATAKDITDEKASQSQSRPAGAGLLKPKSQPSQPRDSTDQKHSSPQRQRPASSPTRAAPAGPQQTAGLQRGSSSPHRRSQSARPSGRSGGMSVTGRSVTQHHRGAAASKGGEGGGLLGEGMPSPYCVVPPKDRLQRSATLAATVPTIKTMARGRSGRLFDQVDLNSALFSVQTPTVAHLEATSLATKREDLQYRVLEYKAMQVQRSSAQCTVPSGGDQLLSSMLGGSGGGGGMAGLTLPPRPFSALMHTGRGGVTSANRPTSAFSQCSSSVVRPHSARLCSSTGERSRRIRPPSAGSWAGRPMRTVVREETEGGDEMLLAEGWDNSTGDPVAMMQVTAFGSLVPV